VWISLLPSDRDPGGLLQDPRRRMTPSPVDRERSRHGAHAFHAIRIGARDGPEAK
jgi:hypothetical protein